MLSKGFLLLVSIILCCSRAYGENKQLSGTFIPDETSLYVLPDSLNKGDTCHNFMTEQVTPIPSKTLVCDTSLYAIPSHPRPWEAGALNMSINVGVWLFDYYVLKRSWCGMSLKDIRRNFKTGFVWDVDNFPTNLFNHPYNGALYFNAARNCGLNFWQSSLYTFGSSAIWEFFSEREPAAINDFLSTGFGGMVIGESTMKVGHLFLNDSKRGIERVAREILATAVDPMGGLVRILHGDMWRVRSTHYLYHDYNSTPVDGSVSVGCRTLGRGGTFLKGDWVNSFDLQCRYGDYFDSGNQPFDVFRARVAISICSHQPTVSRVNIYGKLWLSDPSIHQGRYLAYGIFQHFNYYDSKSIEHETYAPYHISEAASAGPGLVFRWVPSERTHPQTTSISSPQNIQSTAFLSKPNTFQFNQSLFVNFVLLGGCKTDYFGSILRDYNLGSGFSVTSITDVDIPHFGQFSLNLYSMNLYTWKGYTKKDLDAHPNLLYLSSQGDKGNAWVFVLNPALRVNLPYHLALDVEWCRYFRSMHYAYFPDNHSSYSETKLGLSYCF
jgi:hypothetical protein